MIRNAGPLAWATVGLAVGFCAARFWPSDPLHFLLPALAGGLGGVALNRFGKRPAANVCGMLALIGLGGAWWLLRTQADPLPFDDEKQLLTMVEGHLDQNPTHRIQTDGALGRFDHRPPRTRFILNVDRIRLGEWWHPIRTRLSVTMGAFDDRLQVQDRVRCSGWARPFPEPKNPGEYDYAQAMSDRGVVGQLYLKQRRHCRILSTAPTGTWVFMRSAAADAARRSLHAEIKTDPNTAALLEMLLLGTGREDLGPLNKAFSETGLAHLLAISGLHIGILATGIWWLCLMVSGRPQIATVLTIAAVVVYLVLVPARVPIIRAGVMTVIAAAAAGQGRRLEPLAVLSAAALPLLLWRPWDLFRPGFQLSFGIVVALVLFAPRASKWLQGDGLLTPTPRWRRWLCDYLAVCGVAWLAAMPLVCFHFHKISPLSVLLTPLLLPWVAVVLWGGYLKMVLGVLVPPLGAWLGPWVAHGGQLLSNAVLWAAEWPGVVFHVPPVSSGWLLGMLMVTWAMLGGWFAERRWPLVAAWSICLVWLMWPVAMRQVSPNDGAWQLHAWAVGNGSAYLIQSGDQTWMYDCGSSSRSAVTDSILDPALRSAGVHQIHTLVLSHPDLDHFSGVVELIERFHVQRVLINESFLAESSHVDAQGRPQSAAAMVMKHLAQQPVAVECVWAGWTEAFGHLQLKVLWPPKGQSYRSHNDGSLVMSLEGGGRRMVFSGDVQDVAMRRMMASGLPGRADILEIPHHGSLAAQTAPTWAQSIRPILAIQSTAPGARSHNRPWATHLPNAHLCITAEGGAVRLHVDHRGTMGLWRYRKRAWTQDHPPTYNTPRP